MGNFASKNTQLDVTSGAAHVSNVGAGPELSSDSAGTTADGEALAYTTTTQSAAITGILVDVFADTADNLAFIEVGSAPVATTASYPIKGRTSYRIRITSGNKIAVLQDSAGGTLYIHPVE